MVVGATPANIPTILGSMTASTFCFVEGNELSTKEQQYDPTSMKLNSMASQLTYDIAFNY
jgi:hypothetical protein